MATHPSTVPLWVVEFVRLAPSLVGIVDYTRQTGQVTVGACGMHGF